MSRWTVLALIALGSGPLCTAGCATAIDDGPAPAHEPKLFSVVLSQLTEEDSLPVEGDWPGDFGDANYYGPGLFLRYGHASDNDQQIALGEASARFDQRLLARATKDVSFLLENLDHVTMAALGLIEFVRVHPDDALRGELERFISVFDTLASTYDYYPEEVSSSNSYAAGTYGPSTMNATIALLRLEYAYSVGGPNKATHVTRGKAILAKGREKGFDSAHGYYRFSSKQSGLYLYPQVTQIIARLRAHQLTGDKSYLAQAEQLYRAIQPLKVKGEPRYRSPYSAKGMGAKTDDYTTLSSQNYTLLALALLYQQTKKARYRDEIAPLLGWIHARLLRDGRVLHHWIDGRVADRSDPEYYCSGCNLQLLYIIWRLEDMLR